MDEVICSHCQGNHLTSQPAGRNPKYPWMLSHHCLNPWCGKVTFTCNGSCITQNKKRFAKLSYNTPEACSNIIANVTLDMRRLPIKKQYKTHSWT